ncbi:MAG: tRNA pseudouridine(38-40) synthase [uncultured Thermomicrobiales bacterium]|uniref:tRNA pseudouridine synthase A n=1 Tax=uncultured Thermomicrobiales bacterium TaxID=1645740 RepID=A0A6J4UHM0_9BACT|nr:MAG: tRNA pseudouridine(38-40) synthase [uncultured Thermomicrobiales bacterium]
MARLALTIAYDGSDFAGSQVQPGQRTVQAELERAVASALGGEGRTIFAGRTDRGVHASGQVVGCEDRRPRLNVSAVRAAINAQLPADLAVVRVDRRSDAFHARYDALWREYRYRAWSGPPQPLARRVAWYRAESLDPAVMAVAAAGIVGLHDFASLAGAGDGVPWAARRALPRGTTRRVFLCRCDEIAPWWGPESGGGRLIEIRVAADGFLPRMVRNLVGALVEVGRGARPSEWLDEVMVARDRRCGVATAPAHGLTFWRVGYGEETPDADRVGGLTDT